MITAKILITSAAASLLLAGCASSSPIRSAADTGSPAGNYSGRSDYQRNYAPPASYQGYRQDYGYYYQSQGGAAAPATYQPYGYGMGLSEHERITLYGGGN